MSKQRADVILVEKDLAPTRSKAQALILAGQVYVGEHRVEKAAELIAVDAPIEVRGQDHPFVSRGGVKLAGALDAFGFSPQGKTAADFGASTGGFTDCLLQRGAPRVFAIDVGYGQLAHSLRIDPRVIVMERTNARHLTAGDLSEPVDLVVIDASFIGLEKLLPAAKRVLEHAGDVIALVKPQFQVGRANVGKGGVVRDDAARARAVDDVIREAQKIGFHVVQQQDSVIEGPKGNREVFVWLRLT